MIPDSVSAVAFRRSPIAVRNLENYLLVVEEPCLAGMNPFVDRLLITGLLRAPSPYLLESSG
jgi:hypothetical protein